MFTWIGAAMPVQKNTFLGLSSVYIGSNSENSENPLTKQVLLRFCDLTYTWLCLLSEFRESSMMTQGHKKQKKALHTIHIMISLQGSFPGDKKMGVHELQRGREKLLKCSDFKPVKLNFFIKIHYSLLL